MAKNKQARPFTLRTASAFSFKNVPESIAFEPVWAVKEKATKADLGFIRRIAAKNYQVKRPQDSSYFPAQK
jgi:hypothetical protein